MMGIQPTASHQEQECGWKGMDYSHDFLSNFVFFNTDYFWLWLGTGCIVYEKEESSAPKPDWSLKVCKAFKILSPIASVSLGICFQRFKFPEKEQTSSSKKKKKCQKNQWGSKPSFSDTRSQGPAKEDRMPELVSLKAFANRQLMNIQMG